MKKLVLFFMSICLAFSLFGCTQTESLDILEMNYPVTNQSPLGQMVITDLKMDDSFKFEIVPFNSESMTNEQIAISFEGVDFLELTTDNFETFNIHNGETREFKVQIKGNESILKEGFKFPLIATTDFY